VIRIGLISDTHSYLDPKVFKYFEHVDEVWHAGDIGDIQILHDLKAFKPTIAVFGNIDHKNVQLETEAYACHMREGMKILMTHIAGKPPRYNPGVLSVIRNERPGIFICGHSHILKVMPDRENKLLYMNPGAAGRHGFHKVRTLIRFEIDQSKIQNPEVVELGPRGK